MRLLSELEDIHIAVLSLAQNAAKCNYSGGELQAVISLDNKMPMLPNETSPLYIPDYIVDCEIQQLSLVCIDLASRGLLKPPYSLTEKVEYRQRDYVLSDLGVWLLEWVSNE